MDWYFTFGHGQTHPVTGEDLLGGPQARVVVEVGGDLVAGGRGRPAGCDVVRLALGGRLIYRLHRESLLPIWVPGACGPASRSSSRWTGTSRSATARPTPSPARTCSAVHRRGSSSRSAGTW